MALADKDWQNNAREDQAFDHGVNHWVNDPPRGSRHSPQDEEHAPQGSKPQGPTALADGLTQAKKQLAQWPLPE